MSDVQHDQIDMFHDPARVRDGEFPDTPFGDEPHVESPCTSVAAIPYALRNIRAEDVVTRSDFIRELTKQIPLNEYNLPNYYYRPDLLDPKLLMGSAARGENTFVEEMIQAALVPITYEQGFPTIGKQQPIWGQLDFETKEAFNGFLQYIEQPGIRQLRAIQSESPDILLEWFHLHYWVSRAKAYDMFRAAHHARMREHRIMSLESDHFLAGEAIFRRLNKVIAEKTDEDLKAMDIDKVIASLERVAKIQRSAVGLSAVGNGKEQETPRATSVEVIMRNVADDGAKRKQDDTFDMTLFDDPETLDKAQDLIIRVNK